MRDSLFTVRGDQKEVGSGDRGLVLGDLAVLAQLQADCCGFSHNARGDSQGTAELDGTGQGLTSKAEGSASDGCQVIKIFDFTGTIPLADKRAVDGSNAMAIVGDSDDVECIRGDFNCDGGGLSVKGVIDQFFDEGSRVGQCLCRAYCTNSVGW